MEKKEESDTIIELTEINHCEVDDDISDEKESEELTDIHNEWITELEDSLKDEDDYKWYNKCGCSNYDFNDFYNKVYLILFSLIILGCSEITRKYSSDIEIGEVTFWKWLRIASLIPGTYICGILIDFILYLLIDIIGYFERFTTLFIYYANSFRGLIGHIIITILFNSYYEKILDIENTEIINRLALLLIFTYFLLGIRNLLFNFMMRKRLITVFRDNIDTILLYKNIIYNLSFNMMVVTQSYKNIKNEHTHIDNEYGKDISWKFVKLKNTGFVVWKNNTKIQLFRKDKLIKLCQNIWHYLLSTYNKHSKLPETNKRISITYLIEQIKLPSDHDKYMDIVSLFDPQNNTNISEEDFINGINDIYMSWKESASFLVGYNNLSTIFKHLMTAISLFIILIVGLEIFNIPMSDVFVPLATVTVTISFSIGRVLSNMFASIIFIIFVNPYNIGNRVSAKDINEGVNMIVKKINILTTIFRENKSGRLIIVPNHILYGSEICNHHRSKTVIFNLKFKINCDTPEIQLDILKQNIEKYLKLYPNVWKPDAKIYIDYVNNDMNYTPVDFWVQRYGHWGDGTIYDSKTDLMRYIMKIMKDMNIKYIKPTQPIMNIKE